jgi:hypothetical protein
MATKPAALRVWIESRVSPLGTLTAAASVSAVRGVLEQVGEHEAGLVDDLGVSWLGTTSVNRLFGPT